MINHLKGKLLTVSGTEIEIDVSGVGYGVFVSKKVLANIPETGEDISVITYLDVKENSLTLYGFYDRKEKEIFKMLITVNGISCRTAHNILSYAGFEDIISLINSKSGFTSIKIPGIGTKKIELISLALKDKIFKLSGEEFIPDSEKGVATEEKEQTRIDALNALMSLGYQRAEAEKIIREVIKMNPDVSLTAEELIRKSLNLVT